MIMDLSPNNNREREEEGLKLVELYKLQGSKLVPRFLWHYKIVVAACKIVTGLFLHYENSAA